MHDTQLRAVRTDLARIQRLRDLFLFECHCQVDGAVVATGGFLLHYNPPFADLFVEVEPGHRRRGIGAWLVRCLITECYLAGRVPAARCNLSNEASRSTLPRAGMRTCGCMLVGELRQE